MQAETIAKFSIEDEVAEIMADIYNAYISSGYATLEDCQKALLSSMRMLDFNAGLDETVNREAHNEAYYLARGLVRLPFDSGHEKLDGNYLEQESRDRLATAEFVR